MDTKVNKWRIFTNKKKWYSRMCGKNRVQFSQAGGWVGVNHTQRQKVGIPKKIYK